MVVMLVCGWKVKSYESHAGYRKDACKKDMSKQGMKQRAKAEGAVTD